MEKYEPKSRRPIADIFRKTAHWCVDICIKRNIHADSISYLSIVFAGIAGLLFWKSCNNNLFLILGPIFCYLRLWCNMLDGMVALKAKKASLQGEILNDLPDRISDTIIFVGVAHSSLVYQPLGYWTAIFALFVSYIGIFGQAVGVHREFSGLMSKPWRMVLLHLGAWIYPIFKTISFGVIEISIIDCSLIIIILGCIQTMWIRLKNIMKALNEKESTIT